MIEEGHALSLGSRSRKRILYLYLNNIYLGNGAYRWPRLQGYFNKRVGQLNLARWPCWQLVKAPSRYSPVNNLKRAKDRQAYVLTRMVEVGFISPEEKEKALQTSLKVQSRENAYFSKAPYFTEFIRQQIESKYGKEVLYQGGIRIYTKLNLSLQQAAQQAIETGLAALDKRQGFRGPLRTLSDDELKGLEKKKISADPLPLNELLEGVVLSKDEKKKFFSVWVEDRKGTLPFSGMAWALRIKPTPNFKPAKVKSPADLLKVGDAIYVRVKEAPKKDQPPMLSLDQDPLVQGALLCLDPTTGH
jgi:penicillin-binding protein 1A